MGRLKESGDGDAPFPMQYYTVQPNRWTFESTKIREWTESHLEGRVLNACAGRTKLTHDDEIVRNDLNPEMDADYHYDVMEIADHFENGSFDTVVFDPPFSQNQADTTYSGFSIQDVAQVVREFDHLLGEEGKVVGFGFTTTLMPGSLGYIREEVAVFNTFGRMNDWLGTVDATYAE